MKANETNIEQYLPGKNDPENRIYLGTESSLKQNNKY